MLRRSRPSARALRAAFGKLSAPPSGLLGGAPGWHAEDPAAATWPVDARISATCTVRTPELSRDRPPAICMRQELSPDVHTSAWVLLRLLILSSSMAADTSAFLTAKVPSKPQQTLSGVRQVDEIDVTHVAKQPERPVAHAQQPERMAGRVVGDADGDTGRRRPQPRVRRPGRRRLQLVGSCRDGRGGGGEWLVARPPGDLAVLVADRFPVQDPAGTTTTSYGSKVRTKVRISGIFLTRAGRC